MFSRALALTIAKGSLGLVIALAFLGEVSRQACSEQPQTIVHVTEPGVDILIDGLAHHVGSLDQSPMILDLEPGVHQLRMERGGSPLLEETFEVVLGEDVILTAWDPRPAPWPAEIRAIALVSALPLEHESRAE